MDDDLELHPPAQGGYGGLKVQGGSNSTPRTLGSFFPKLRIDEFTRSFSRHFSLSRGLVLSSHIAIAGWWRGVIFRRWKTFVLDFSVPRCVLGNARLPFAYEGRRNGAGSERLSIAQQRLLLAVVGWQFSKDCQLLSVGNIFVMSHTTMQPLSSNHVPGPFSSNTLLTTTDIGNDACQLHLAALQLLSQLGCYIDAQWSESQRYCSTSA